MSAFSEYFDARFMISLKASVDRREHASQEFSKHDIGYVNLFPAHDFRDYKAMPENIRKGMDNAMYGCTASHGALLNIVAYHGFDKTLILEDDFEIFQEDFNARFEAMLPFIPDDWDILYLGAGYAENPIRRVNEHVLKVGCMKTTSTYAIRAKHARFVAPLMAGGSAPDDVLSGVNHLFNAYCITPRLFGQYPNTSTIFGQFTHNSQSMFDTSHESTV